jgi:hypothetical protein
VKGLSVEKLLAGKRALDAATIEVPEDGVLARQVFCDLTGRLYCVCGLCGLPTSRLEWCDGENEGWWIVGSCRCLSDFSMVDILTDSLAGTFDQ